MPPKAKAPERDWNDPGWLEAARGYHNRQSPGWQNRAPEAICHQIAMALLNLRVDWRIDWAASRIHDYFLAKGVYQAPVPLTTQYGGNYMEPMPFPASMRLKKNFIKALEVNRTRGRRARCQRLQGQMLAQAGAVGVGIAQSQGGPATQYAGWRGSPILGPALSWYVTLSPNTRRKNSDVVCKDIVIKGLDFKPGRGADYVASRVHEVFHAARVFHANTVIVAADQPEYWIAAKNLWNTSRIVQYASNLYMNDLQFQEEGLTDGTICQQLAEWLGRGPEQMKVELMEYIASRIYDYFTFRKVWDEERTFVLGAKPAWYTPPVKWFHDDGQYAAPEWLPFAYELQGMLKGLAEVYAPPEELFPDVNVELV